MNELLLHTLVALRLAAVLASMPIANDASPTIGEEIVLESGRDSLAASVFLPEGDGPFPGAVFIAGAGDASYRMGWEGESPWYLWPELKKYFIQRGFALILYDKAGTGRSTGNWRRQDFNDRTREAMAAVRAMAARPEIDPGRIGLIGQSQGGWVALQAATDHAEEVAFVILLAGPAQSVRAQVRDEMDNRWRCAGSSLPRLRRMGLSAGLGVMTLTGKLVPTGFLSRIIHFDPAPRLERIEQPVLALYGTNDWMVNHAPNVKRMERHFGRLSGNRAITVQVVDGANHWFSDGGGCPMEAPGRTFLTQFWQALDDPSFWNHLEVNGHRTGAGQQALR